MARYLIRAPMRTPEGASRIVRRELIEAESDQQATALAKEKYAEFCGSSPMSGFILLALDTDPSRLVHEERS